MDKITIKFQMISNYNKIQLLRMDINIIGIGGIEILISFLLLKQKLV